MTPFDDEELDGALERWVERQEAAAPELSAPQELRRRVARRRRNPRLVYARLGAVAAIVVALIALGRHFLGGDGPTRPERPYELVAWETGKGPRVDGPVLRETRGPKKGGAFAQLLFQHHHPGAPAVRSLDVLQPPDERPELAVGDRLRVGLRLSREARVYVLLVREGGEVVPLFPSPPEAVNPVPASRPLYVPEEPRWLALNVAERGTRVVAVASPEPIAALEGDGEGARDWLEASYREPPRGVEVVEFPFDSK